MRRSYCFAVIMGIFLLAGCSYSSVGHLQRQPWILNSPQQLEMRFWKFTYTAQLAQGQYTLVGKAEPVLENLPSDLHWIEDLWLAVYLSDDQGRVLAQDLTIFTGLPLDSGKGIQFAFALRPDQLARSSSLQVTFGYNMTLTPHEHYTLEELPAKQRSGERTRVFFAHEGALTKI
ncbi:hypothetical protein [Desulfonatronum parangueonense]